MSNLALKRHLLPLLPFLETKGVTEICINRPGEVFVEANGNFTRHDVDELEYDFLESLAALVAESNGIAMPVSILGGSLPDGERVQFVLPPAAEKGTIVCSIRKQQRRNMSLDDYEGNGAFETCMSEVKSGSVNTRLNELHRQDKKLELIKLAVKSRKNVLICGGTGTGKTTFLNACLQEVPMHERLITVEDTREVIANQPNAANLLFNEAEQDLSALNIFKACLRLRPDRIILSELRGNEVWPFLRAANSGHPGSISTVHADSPEGAITQLVFMMQQAGSTSNEEQIRKYVQSIIHVIVQLKRGENQTRYMSIDSVYLGG